MTRSAAQPHFVAGWTPYYPTNMRAIRATKLRTIRAKKTEQKHKRWIHRLISNRSFSCSGPEDYSNPPRTVYDRRRNKGLGDRIRKDPRGAYWTEIVVLRELLMLNEPSYHCYQQVALPYGRAGSAQAARKAPSRKRRTFSWAQRGTKIAG